jgi:uncharacterized repeat protein (TIGR01451 family)
MSLKDRLDNFGRSLFGSPKNSAVADDGEQEQKASDRSSRSSTGRQTYSSLRGNSRVGSSSPSARNDRVADAPRAGSSYGQDAAGTATTAPNASGIVRVTQRTSPIPASLPDEKPANKAVSDLSLAGPVATGTNGNAPLAAAPSNLPNDASKPRLPGMSPLHERMSGFRQSPFSGEGESSKQESGSMAETGVKPAPERRDLASDSTSDPADSTRTDRVADRRAGEPSLNAPSQEHSAKTVATPNVAASASPTLANPPVPGAGISGSRPGGEKAASIAKGNEPSNADRVSKSTNDSVLFSRQSPILSVETIGPRKIAVGKESAYELLLHNSGQVAADQVVVTIDLPDWTDVLGAEASVGATNSAKTKAGPSQFLWKVGRLDAKASERLVMRIVPRQSRPFDLAVKWDYTPVASQAMIEVQEAKLALALQGPREVLYGKGEVFRLEISNKGNGDAENVMISLAPTTPGEKQAPASHRFGTLSAGQKKSIDVELTARQTGELVIDVEAQGDGGLRAKLSERLLVRRAALKIDVEAPKLHFVGNEVAYRIRVSNSGNAAAKNALVTATLPVGAKFLASPQKPQLSSDRKKVTWTLENLAPAGETTLSMTCDATTAGVARLDVQATAEGDLATTASATTQVEATANLTMNVEDPSGPIATGSEAVYQIRLENRGTASADNIEVKVFFSDGFDPVVAEGHRHQIGAGQVTFERIPSLAASQNTLLKVRAKASSPGNHIFRVEVRSEATGTRLVREGTTRFYGNVASGGNTSSPIVQPKTPLLEPKPSDTALPNPQTATRRAHAESDSDLPGGSQKK